MRLWIFLFVLAWAGRSVAGEMFVYTDPDTKRDVFVNDLEQVPVQYRDLARPVHAGATEPVPAEDPATLPTPATVSTSGKVELTFDDLRLTATGSLTKPGTWREIGRTFTALMDQKLQASGRAGLYPSEVIALSKLIMVVMVLMLVAWVASLLAWIIFLFHAFRSGRISWMVGMILFFPLAYLYALLCVEKRRWLLRFGGFAAVLSPMLVGVFAAWRAMAWIRAVMEIRGGMG